MKFCVLLMSVVLSSCAIMGGPEQIDQKLYDTHMTQTFPYSKNRCFAATQKAFKAIHVEVKGVNEKEGTIITEKATMEKIATTTGGASGNGYSASYSGSTRVDVLEHKFVMKITGDNTACTVATTQYRVWLNNEEGTQVNVQYAKNRFWVPLFSAIKDELEDGNKISKR